jgi:hypothetical protein
MANVWDENNDEQDESTGIRQLRSHVKDLEKQLKTLTAERDELAGKQRQATVAEIVKSRNLPDKVATLVPADVGMDPAAVTKWLDDYADVFGAKAEAATEAEQTQDATPQGLSQADIAQMRQVDQIAGQAQAPEREQDLMAKIAAAQSMDDLDQLVLGYKRSG